MSTDHEREALDRLLADVYPVALRQRLRAEIAGWMPRPEPRSEEWEAMVERAARELIPDGETPSEGILERAEVMLRAALAAPDTGGPDGE